MSDLEQEAVRANVLIELDAYTAFRQGADPASLLAAADKIAAWRISGALPPAAPVTEQTAS